MRKIKLFIATIFVIPFELIMPNAKAQQVCFEPAVNISMEDTSAYPFGITSNDFNGDGNIDLAVANYTDSNNIAVFLGTGTGSFGTPAHFLAGGSGAIVAADFNGDGHTDLATDYISLLLGDGSGVFGSVADYPSGGALTCADFNQDGKLDLATLIETNMAYMAYVLLGTGSGTFVSPDSFNVGNLPRDITSGDFNGDGKIDIATANDFSDNISILINCTTTGINQPFTGKESITVYPNPANESLLVKTDNNSSMFRVSIYDMLGNKIISTKEKEIDIRSLQNGIYLVKVETGKSVQTKKIVIHK